MTQIMSSIKPGYLTRFPYNDGRGKMLEGVREGESLIRRLMGNSLIRRLMGNSLDVILQNGERLSIPCQGENRLR